MKVYAIIPARSGSVGYKDKNIKKIDNKPLLAYSIEFAKELKCVDRIFCSTDSQKYANIAIKYGAEVPFLRSVESSSSNSMEDDVLKDLREKFKLYNIDEPDLIVWLRPTFIFRSIEDVTKCVDLLKTDQTLTASRTVIQTENRLYRIDDNLLLSNFIDKGKSMIRRQDIEESFKVYSTDVFRFKNNNFTDSFLGDKISPVITNKICGLDIDDEFDFNLVKCIVENDLLRSLTQKK
jgi:CMP-N,N'-diacetyllegionaminic acid synthase